MKKIRDGFRLISMLLILTGLVVYFGYLLVKTIDSPISNMDNIVFNGYFYDGEGNEIPAEVVNMLVVYQFTNELNKNQIDSLNKYFYLQKH